MDILIASRNGALFAAAYDNRTLERAIKKHFTELNEVDATVVEWTPVIDTEADRYLVFVQGDDSMAAYHVDRLAISKEE